MEVLRISDSTCQCHFSFEYIPLSYLPGRARLLGGLASFPSHEPTTNMGIVTLTGSQFVLCLSFLYSILYLCKCRSCYDNVKMEFLWKLINFPKK